MNSHIASIPGLFDSGAPIYAARAPGRLDVMGGIADYSGSLVLELPIAEAAEVAVQQSTTPDVTVASRDGKAQAGERIVTFASDQWSILRRAEYAAARQLLTRDPATAWAAYILGPVLVLLREHGARLPAGLRILVDSRVPEGKGVSSSAAVEVATMRALAALLEIELPGEELARLCQLAENLLVGAPCGIMDEMTSALGRENQLLALRCQPAIVEGYVPIPTGIAFWGIDSGIRHAVSGSDYGSVRCGAFMGYRIIAEAAGLAAHPVPDSPGQFHVEDPHWHGYLANISPHEFHDRFATLLPERITGRDFLARYGGTTDRVTSIDSQRTYAVWQPTLHPIEENARVTRFGELLNGPIDEEALREMARLMFTSHASYSACGLGSDGTDLLVELVRAAGPACGLYGAKITGGGSGGTVAVLARAGAEEAVEKIARKYFELTARPTYIFSGSSPGACAAPVQQMAV